MRLLLLTDAALDEQSLGMNRTLYNLLHKMPELELLLGTSSTLQPKHESYFSQVPRKFFPTSLIPAWIPGGKTLNQIGLEYLPLHHFQKDEIDLVLLCVQSVESAIVFSRVLHELQKPYLVYWMDDLQDYEKESWGIRNAFRVFQEITKKASGLLSVSEPLLHNLETRYGVHGKKSFLVHNPVPTQSIPLNTSCRSAEDPFRLVYAGSLWPMHLDAFLMIAQRLGFLAESGLGIELLVYTPRHFWSAIRELMPASGVIFGGELSYEECQAALLNADCGLVTSSFLPQYAHLSKTSLQTKVTEYLAAGLPILSCGPPEAITHSFVEHWKCGIILCSQEEEHIDASLHALVRNKGTQFSKRYILDIVSKNFSQQIIQKQFFDFCQACLQAH